MKEILSRLLRWGRLLCGRAAALVRRARGAAAWLEARPAAEWVVGLAVVLGEAVLLFALVWPWRPDISPDTLSYYYPAQAAVNSTNATAARVLIEPFYRQPSEGMVLPDEDQPGKFRTLDLINAHESKPVFVAALRVWGVLYQRVVSSDPIPNAREYTMFMVFSCWLVGLVLWRLARRLGHAWAGLSAGAIVLLSPWSMALLYYPAYTQLSIVFYLLAVLAVLRRTARASFAAGLLGWLSLLSNSSMPVYLFGLGLLVGCIHLPDWKKSVVQGLLYAGGLLAPFGLFALLGHTALVRHLFTSPEIDSPWTTLVKYYDRSIYYNHFSRVDVPKYTGMMLLVLAHNSWVVLASFIVMPLVFIWKLAREGWRRCLEPGVLRSVSIVWLSAVVGILAIDLRPGVQLGRSYFVGYALCVLGILLLARELWRERSAWRYGLSALLLLYVPETAGRLVEQRHVFHDFGEFACGEFSAGRQIAMFWDDLHARCAHYLVQNQCGAAASDQVVPVRLFTEPRLLKERRIAHLVLSPETFTLWPGTHMAEHIVPRGDLQWKLAGIGPVVPAVRREIPLFVLYPLLVFEDELQTWRFIRREFVGNSYKKGSGTAKACILLRGYVTKGDVNGDGRLDYLVFDTDYGDKAIVWVALANDHGYADPTAWLQFGRSSPDQLQYGDVNGDGLLDVLYHDVGGSEHVWVSFSTGTGFTMPKRKLICGNATSDQLHFGDVDGDGRDDALFYECRGSGEMLVSLSKGTGFKPPQAWQRFGVGDPWRLKYGDINGDGKLDAFLLDRNEQGRPMIRIYLSTGLSFAGVAVMELDEQLDPQSIQFGDVNGDGKSDALFLDTRPANRAILFLGASQGFSFEQPTPAWKIPGKCTAEQVHCVDVDADGKADVVFHDRERSKGLLIGYSKGASFADPVPCRNIAEVAPVVR